MIGGAVKEYKYFRGKGYQKIGRFEVIKEGAMQSWHNNGLQFIRDPRTIGDIPDNFSPQREFYNPISSERKRK